MRRRNEPSGDATEPNAIDPRSGFKVKLSELRREWTGDMVAERFWDRRNPQDLVRAVADNQALPFSRPETLDISVSLPILTEDDNWLYSESGQAIYTEGPGI
jgi:hypothetical protein